MPEDLNRANLIGVARVAAPEDGAREALQKVHPVILSVAKNPGILHSAALRSE
jgi:hypothetical protein